VLAARAPSPRPALLPGPTGERNTHALVPRARVLCTGASPAELLLQLAVVLATGGAAGWLAGNPADALLAELPPALRARIARIDDPLRDAFDAALVRAERAPVRDWSRRLAERAGPIVGVHPLPADPQAAAAGFALERLMVERTLSVNTAAAGGNASLMTIG
jgi:RHH-type proline utilization regulon transcriptional repressor/proline dehydrogenase/delta 1-pyrroline-5-carboxylate dehydrogenase